ncbi:recombinase family protein [Streptomyces niveus]|uniref:recombinase family protein n=1 Tax=Streptomyces niveus TaxID=193462 RepID=UPI00368C4374
MEQLVPKRPALYCRLSYAPDGSVEAVERQEADGREMAVRLQWPEFCCVYVDNSRSAWQRNRRRPDWDKMLISLGADADHRHDGIMVYHGDRLIRQPYDLELLLNISDQQRTPLASVSGVRDLSNPDDRFILRIEAAQACRESDNISRRVRRKLKHKREELGLTTTGGKRPFGFGVQIGTKEVTDADGQTREVPVYDMTKHVPEEAGYLVDAANQRLAGRSKAGVVRWMNTKCTTTEGNPWTPKSLGNVLLAPRIAGLIEYSGELFDAAWDGILARDVWEDLKALDTLSREKHPYPGRERRYLLSGVGGAECGCCGGYVMTKPAGGRNRKTIRIYHCNACKKVGRSVAHLDAYVEGRTVALLNDPRFLAELSRPADADNVGPAAEIATLERRRETVKQQVKSLVDHPDIDAGLALAAIASFDQKINTLRNRMAASAGERLILRMAGISQEQWKDLPVDIRSSTVRALFRVVIMPTTRRGPGFDPDAIKITRRSLVDVKPTD